MANLLLLIILPLWGLVACGDKPAPVAVESAPAAKPATGAGMPDWMQELLGATTATPEPEPEPEPTFDPPTESAIYFKNSMFFLCRSNMDGENVEILSKEDFYFLNFHPNGRQIFYLDWRENGYGDYPQYIIRADLNGANKDTLHTISWNYEILDMVVDHLRDKAYMMRRRSSDEFSLFQVDFSDASEEDMRHYNSASVPAPLGGAMAVDHSTGKLYWIVNRSSRIGGSDGSVWTPRIFHVDPNAAPLPPPEENNDPWGRQEEVFDPSVPSILVEGYGGKEAPSGRINDAAHGGEALYRTLFVDSDQGKIYWTSVKQSQQNRDDFTHYIQRANLDGSEIELLLQESSQALGSSNPIRSMDLDPVSGMMYYTARGGSSVDGPLYKAPLDDLGARIPVIEPPPGHWVGDFSLFIAGQE